MMDLPIMIQSLLDPWFVFLAQDPLLRFLQLIMLGFGIVQIFLVFFVTRDVLLRTHSFCLMLFCIVITAALPLIGFLFYLLIRPARTIKERELEAMLKALTSKRSGAPKKPFKKKPVTTVKKRKK